MILEKGNLVNDGENDLLICSAITYDKKEYVLLLNMETDELGFYYVKMNNDIYDFSLVKDENLIEKLLFHSAKNFLKKNEDNDSI